MVATFVITRTFAISALFVGAFELARAAPVPGTSDCRPEGCMDAVVSSAVFSSAVPLQTAVAMPHMARGILEMIESVPPASDLGPFYTGTSQIEPVRGHRVYSGRPVPDLVHIAQTVEGREETVEPCIPEAVRSYPGAGIANRRAAHEIPRDSQSEGSPFPAPKKEVRGTEDCRVDGCM
ncbi:hypothetical protein AcW1_003461 [Taiwanofungus camphoratus]|nr:hypothetical protein AcW1_003461 [Antrodia cinnamomea]